VFFGTVGVKRERLEGVPFRWEQRAPKKACLLNGRDDAGKGTNWLPSWVQKGFQTRTGGRRKKNTSLKALGPLRSGSGKEGTGLLFLGLLFRINWGKVGRKVDGGGKLKNIAKGRIPDQEKGAGLLKRTGHSGGGKGVKIKGRDNWGGTSNGTGSPEGRRL